MLKKLYAWWVQKSQRDLLLEAVSDARLFEEWEAAAYKLDEVLDYDMTKYAVVRVAEVREKIAYADIEQTWSDGGSADAAPVASRIEAQMSARALSGAAASASTGDSGGGGKKKKKDN